MKPKTEIILINISGDDKPGVTTALAEVLARYDAFILDIGQADIHHTLSLGILFKTDETKSGDILKDLLFKLWFQKNSSRIPDIQDRQDSHTLSGPGWIFKSKMKCQIRFSWTAVLPQELQFPPYGFSGFHIFFQIPEVRQHSYRL